MSMFTKRCCVIFFNLFFAFWLSIASVGFSEQVEQNLSEQNSYPFRDISKPILKDSRFEKVIVLSPPRVGSTLVYMIFQYLFEDTLGDHTSFAKRVIKSHGQRDLLSYIRENTNLVVVIPIRHPIDAFYSAYKFWNVKGEQGIFTLLRDIEASYLEIKESIKHLEKKKICLLRYEEFSANFECIFKKLSRDFKIEVPIGEKEKINQLFNKKAVLKYASAFESFHEYNPITGVHGDHISLDNRPMSEVFPPEILKKINQTLLPIGALFGY